MIKYSIATTEEHLIQILQLQQDNLPKNITTEAKNNEGFVTLEHSLDLLKELNSPHAHIIALDGDKVVGYTLITIPEHVVKIPLLQSTLDELVGITHNTVNISRSRFFIMGQVCIDRDYRGQGIFQGLYDSLSQRMSNDFDFIVTEIATHNYRSMKAHAKVGFQIIKRHRDDLAEWAIVVLDIRNHVNRHL